MSKPEQPEQPEEVKPPSKLTLWINANGIDFALWFSFHQLSFNTIDLKSFKTVYREF